MELLSELGLWGLGLSAFLAATLLPLSSKLVLSALLLSGENPLAVTIIATFGNVLASVVNYLIGRWGVDGILHRWFRLSQKLILIFVNVGTKQLLCTTTVCYVLKSQRHPVLGGLPRF